MSWLYENFSLTSEKNGKIFFRRLFGRWKVTVGGYDQTSRYITDMWKDALRRVPPNLIVKKVLLLGFGAGGTIELLREQFPKSQITVVEWDPVMVEIAGRIKFFEPGEDIQIILGDANLFVPELADRFDVIIFDLYCGEQPQLINDPAFREVMRRRLSPSGFLVANVFHDAPILERFGETWKMVRSWRFKFNRLGLLQRDDAPSAGGGADSSNFFIPYRTSRAYLKPQSDGTHVQFLDNRTIFGTRWHHGPLWFDGYAGDPEPDILPGPARFVIWQPLTFFDAPKGWRRSWIQMNPRKTGFAILNQTENYWKTWSEHAQRHRKKWMKEDRFTIEPIAFDEFAAAYRPIKKLGWMTEFYVRDLQHKMQRHEGCVHLFGARERSTGKVLAGLAVMDIPEINCSVHVIAFIHPSAMHSSVSTGLIDHWFQHAIRAGLSFLDFDIFWAPGEPRVWKGFSRFKSQFGTRFIRYPFPLVRIVKGGPATRL